MTIRFLFSSPMFLAPQAYRFSVLVLVLVVSLFMQNWIHQKPEP